MTRLFPASLFGQTLLLLLGGLIVSHAIGSFIYSLDRESAVRAVGGLATAQRIANVSRLVEDMPADWRARLIAGLSDASLRVELTGAPPFAADSDPGPVAHVIRDYLARQLRLPPAREPVVAVDRAFAPPFGGGFGPPHMERMRGERGERRDRDRRMRDFGGPPLALQVAVPLSNGQWLSFATDLPSGGAGFSNRYLISMLIMAGFILAISVWAVRRLTRPLSAIAQAADRLGRNVNAPPLPESGTAEMRQAAAAFNSMQSKLRAMIDNRTTMLAALSHDLRTPLTLLRLRAESVENAEERERMLATIADMDAMIGATLQYAREQAAAEPKRSADVTALLQSLVDDMAEAGFDVVMQAAAPVSVTCQPGALKRALTNLIENAVKYGERARVSLSPTPTTVEIAIEDDGPGLPQAELARVFEPFYRLETSRSRDTGGVGLGLAIAQAAVTAQDGTLTLENREPKGLRARIVLPR